ncbi:MAG: zinc-binding dehydrogenase [Gammaproteobacteria bacterium]
MKAVVLETTGGPEELQIKDVPTPEPAAGEVRVKLEHSALNRRDYWLTVGRYPGAQLPGIAGSDGVGVVDAAGAGVDAALIGKRVVVYPAREWGDRQEAFGPDFRVLGIPDQGTFAEYICAPASDVYDQPQHLSSEQAAAVPLGGLTAWRAVVTQGGVSAGQKVLVTGAGSGVSTFAILWAANLGAEVWVTSGSAEKIKKAKGIGATDGISYQETDFHKKLKKATGGFDVVIDSAGGEAMNAVLDTLKEAGRYVFFGATMGDSPVGLQMIKLFFRHIRIQGTTMGSNQEFAAMLDFVAKKKIEPVIDRVMPLDEAVAAHKLLEGFSQTGKIVLQH